ncbi:MAG: peptidase M23 [Proteobacteria bacterium]|nr:MAG: peptidase M23 [Pseudomonadota bacterium]
MVLMIAFTLFAIADILSVGADAHVDSRPIFNDVPIPTTPLMSFSENGLIGTEQLKSVQRVVKKGETLSGIFTDLGLSQGLLLKIAHFNEDSRLLTKVMPGNALDFKLTHDGELAHLSYQVSEFKTLLIHYDMGQVSTEIVTQEQQVHLVSTHGVIEHSVFTAGKKAGLSDKMIMDLANIFSWDIDFVLEIRAGDQFSLIYEKVYKEGEFFTDGRILAASFTNQDRHFEAVLYDAGDSEPQYYAPNGRSMKKAFLRAPLNFSYISSSFNPKRLHPVTKRVKAHRGIDYSAPTGTPVYAAGAGKVIRSAYNKYNGHHVFIQHPNGIITKYLHFSKRSVKQGQRVKQKQTIGYVGATGLATGPHLHYEFIYNGVHRNPRTVDLPKAEPLPANKMADFHNYARPILGQLHNINNGLIAQIE